MTTNAGDGTDSAGAVAIHPTGRSSWRDSPDALRWTASTSCGTRPTGRWTRVRERRHRDRRSHPRQRRAGALASGIAIQPDGKIVVVGDTGGGAEFTSGFGLARFDDDDTPDVTFHGDGTVVTNFTRWDDGASGLGIQPDGKIVAVGVAGYSLDAVATFALVRYDPDGTLDGSFGDNGKLRTRFPTIASTTRSASWARGRPASRSSPTGDVLAGSAVRVLDGHLDGRFALARYRG